MSWDPGARRCGGRKRVREYAADPELIALEKTDVVVVQPKAVRAVERDLAVGWTHEEGLAILDHDRVADASD